MEIPTKQMEKAEAETKEQQYILGSNAWHLVRYVIEHDHEIPLPDDFNTGRFLCWAEEFPDLKLDDKICFINQYAMLEKVTENVTARTLVATRIHGRGFFHAAFFTSVGKYLLFLSIVTLIFVYLLIANITGLRDMNSNLIPFSAAGLGTCVFLLRVTQEKLKSREFDPANIPSHLIRLSLGVLAGGSIVLFPDLVGMGGDLNIGADKARIGEGALAFVLGYAVDIFYGVLDNIGGRIKRR